MSGKNNIREAIRALAKNDSDESSIKLCEVTATYGTTIDVIPVSGEAAIYDVRIQSSTEKEGILMTPQVGSYVIVGMISNETGYLLSTNTLSDIKIKANGVDIHEQMKSLFDMLSNLIGILKQFQLMTAQGPTTNVMPQVVAQLQQQDTKLSQIQNQLNKVLKQFN